MCLAGPPGAGVDSVGLRPSAVRPGFGSGFTGTVVQKQTVSAASCHVRDGGKGAQSERLLILLCSSPVKITLLVAYCCVLFALFLS